MTGRVPLTEAAGIVFACGLLGACGEPRPADLYPGPWTVPTAATTRALLSNNVADCRDAVARANVKTGSSYVEYLVYCRPRGGEWAAFVVAPAISKVSAQRPVFDDIPPPR
ncbi:MAG: hypothetical protein U1E56_12435 [Bauldia sp.]